MDTMFDASWNAVLEPLLSDSSMKALSDYVTIERENHLVFPPKELVFNAMKLTSFDDVKVVILGQDPYHNIGQAHGLSFSVPDGIAFPPSLRNIFAELSTDINGFEIPLSGDLTSWAKQGVLLLNATLTVRAHEAGSHQKKGWEEFTDAIIKAISERLENVVFVLWGAYAQKKVKLIDTNKHLILKSVHPSPLSVYRGFYSSKPFSTINSYLLSKGKETINWHLV